MNIDKKTLNNLLKQNLPPREQIIWMHIASEKTDPDGYFHFDGKEWSIRLDISERHIKKSLKKLEDKDDIQRIYKKGRLFIRPLVPETTDCMKFYATFAKGVLLNTADNEEPSMWLLFKDIYNRSGTIRFSQCSALLKGNEMKRCQNLIPGKTVCFSASLKVTQSDKEILAVTNIQPIQRYYYA